MSELLSEKKKLWNGRCRSFTAPTSRQVPSWQFLILFAYFFHSFQKRFSIFGKNIDIILIARRSRHYAGTRYLKRGLNVHGKVANDCEVEQVRFFTNYFYSKFTNLAVSVRFFNTMVV